VKEEKIKSHRLTINGRVSAQLGGLCRGKSQQGWYRQGGQRVRDALQSKSVD